MLAAVFDDEATEVTDDDPLYLAEQLAASQMVSVAFKAGSKCTVNKNYVSLFDSGSSRSFIRRSLVPFGCEVQVPSVYRGMGNVKLNSHGEITCVITFRNRVITHRFIILPDAEALVPLLIGRDLLPKLNVHLCRTKRQYSRDRLIELNTGINKSNSLDNKTLCALDSLAILRHSFRPEIDDLLIAKVKSTSHSLVANGKRKNDSIVKTKIKPTDDPITEAQPKFVDPNEMSYNESELELIELNDDGQFENFVDLGGLVSTVTECDAPDALIVNTELSELDVQMVRHVVETEYLHSQTPIEPNDYSMQIRVANDVPIHCAPRRLSYYERNEIQKTVDKLMSRGIVQPSDSPYASAIVLVKKKNGEIRMCVDYRAINRVTIRDNYPIPLIEDCLEYFSGKRYFSTLDLRDGFHHIPMNEDSVKYTSFVTPFGQFEYTHMPFGLKNAPAVFQRYIHLQLKPLIDKGLIVVYLDDVSIATSDLNSHIEVLREVLRRIRTAGLELNLKKCQFAFTEIDYLGYRVSENGIRPSTVHVEAIKSYPMPTNTKEVQRCNGLFSYFRRFVPKFAQVAKPITDLLRKDAKFEWTDACTVAFEYLRDRLTISPVLSIYDPKREIELHCDASSHGFGAVLMQRQDDGKFHPVAYYSRKTSKVEAKLISFELETLAVVYALARFHTFVDRLPFTIVTDCEALSQTLKKRDVNPRIAKWALALENYEYKIQHRKGERMTHVDALSRTPVVAAIEATDVDVNVQITQSRDEHIQSIREKLETGECPGYVLEDGLVFRSTGGNQRQLMVPLEMEENLIRLVHEKYGHVGVDKCANQIAKHYWFSNMREKIGRFVRNCLKCIYYSAPHRKNERNLHNIPKSPVPFDTVHIDHFGPLPAEKSRAKYVFAVVDAFTKFVKLYPVNTPGTKEACNALNKYFDYYSRPRRIISDRGTSFTSQDFGRFVRDHNIEHVKVAVASPQSNGQVERVNRDLKAMLAKLAESDEHSDWKQKLTQVEYAMNNASHTTTGVAPSKLLFGVEQRGSCIDELTEYLEERLANEPVELVKLREKASAAIEKSQAYNLQYFNDHHTPAVEFDEGEFVVIRNVDTVVGTNKKLVPKYRGPYIVKKKLDNDRYVIEDVENYRVTQIPYHGILDSSRMRRWVIPTKSSMGDKMMSEATLT